MKLQDIGFYTLTDERAKHSCMISPLWRCELILTDRCNFHCPYCRGLQNGGDLPIKDAVSTLKYWFSEHLKNLRFSGGEPTLYEELPRLVFLAAKNRVDRIAISTNGSASSKLYRQLIADGANDFSVSLDSCCAGTGNVMNGRKGMFKKICKNIELLSSLTYVTVGVVLTETNSKEASRIITLAHNLGVADIRIIPSAQDNRKLSLEVDNSILIKHPILKYRFRSKRHVRGLDETDSTKCKLVLDDMAVWNGEHYPCIIYLREGGRPIGKVNSNMRGDRFNWYCNHDSMRDRICRNNCLDVCRDFNNKCRNTNQ